MPTVAAAGKSFYDNFDERKGGQDLYRTIADISDRHRELILFTVNTVP